MIGRWLALLTPEQEDRVLTTAMQAGQYPSPCLVGTVGNHTRGVSTTEFRDRLGKASYGTLQSGFPGYRSIEIRFDELCSRFGASRVCAAIRNRILRHRAARTLAPVEAVHAG